MFIGHDETKLPEMLGYLAHGPILLGKCQQTGPFRERPATTVDVRAPVERVEQVTACPCIGPRRHAGCPAGQICRNVDVESRVRKIRRKARTFPESRTPCRISQRLSGSQRLWLAATLIAMLAIAT
jgi:hypothetical protein